MKTKFFRVATSGPTIDGREITPAQIDQMAASYSPQTYAARVWMEHLRSMLPDSPFKAYGDVLALKSDAVEDGKRGLFAQIDATDELVQMNGARQKLFWSVELIENFAKTGGAYLGGLAVTDSPASLGTEMLTFAVKSEKLPESLKSHLFSVGVESSLEAEDTPRDTGPGLLSRVKDLLSGKGKTDDARFGQIETSVIALAEEMAKVRQVPPAAPSQADTAGIEQLKTAVADLTERLSKTPISPARPLAAGGTTNQTDC